MFRFLATIAVAIVAAGSNAASAQDVTSSRTIGGWILHCTVDGMTDKTRCSQVTEGRRVEGTHAIYMFWRETETTPSLRFAGDGDILRGALVRVDRNQPIPLRICNERGRICMPGLKDEAVLAEQIKVGQKMLLRATPDGTSNDYLFDLSGYEEASAQHRRLQAAAGEPLANRPVDALELGEIERLAALERQERERAAAAKVVADIQRATASARSRCDKTFQPSDPLRKDCFGMATYCSEKPVPKSAQQFRDCFAIWFPDSRFVSQ